MDLFDPTPCLKFFTGFLCPTGRSRSLLFKLPKAFQDLATAHLSSLDPTTYTHPSRTKVPMGAGGHVHFLPLVSLALFLHLFTKVAPLPKLSDDSPSGSEYKPSPYLTHKSLLSVQHPPYLSGLIFCDSLTVGLNNTNGSEG